jgi:hypothetical protein
LKVHSGEGLVATTTQRGKPASRKGRARSADAQRRESTGAPTESGARTATVRLPFVTAEFSRPELHLPGRAEVEGAVSTVRENLPSREQMVYYGGLTLLAVLSVIEWPVAAAIGVGTVVAQRAAEHGPDGRRSRSSTAAE